MAKIQKALSTGGLSDEELVEHMRVVETALADPEAELLPRVGFLCTGVNGSYVAQLSNGLWVVWKPAGKENQSRLRRHLPPGQQGPREAAAYDLDRRMGHLARIPPAVFRELGGDVGAVIFFNQDAVTLRKAPFRERARLLAGGGEYGNFAVFDHTSGQLDRHPDNVLYPWCLCDQGLAFPLENGEQGDHNFLFSKLVELDDRQLAALRALQAQEREVFAAHSETGIPPAATEAMFERTTRMEKAGRTLNDWRRS
jgi:hypothetical protein